MPRQPRLCHRWGFALTDQANVILEETDKSHCMHKVRTTGRCSAQITDLSALNGLLKKVHDLGLWLISDIEVEAYSSNQ